MGIADPTSEKALQRVLELPSLRGGQQAEAEKRVRSLAKTLSPQDQKKLLAFIRKLAASVDETTFAENVQLELLATALRLASLDHDEMLARLAGKHGGAAGDKLVEVLAGGEAYGLPPGAQRLVAGLLTVGSIGATPVSGFTTLWHAMAALFAQDPAAAREQWLTIIAKGTKATSARDKALVRIALGHIEQHEGDLQAWLPRVQKLEQKFAHQVRQFQIAMAKRATPPAKSRGPEVGTEGGPPLLVPTAHLVAWLGTEGPKPFDTGESDYERACDLDGGELLSIGKGQGVVLHNQYAEIIVEPKGLLLRSEGQAPGPRWKKTGFLTVGKGGVVVLDAAESGKSKGPNRKTVDLAPGRYEVASQRVARFVGVRLVRAEAEHDAE